MINPATLGNTKRPYNIQKSLMFDDNSESFLSRTFGAGNQSKWTFSVWIKESEYDRAGGAGILQCYVANSDRAICRIQEGGNLYFSNYQSSSFVDLVTSDGTFIDPAVFTHFIWRYDTSQASEYDRVRLYVNGVQQNRSSIDFPTLNYSSGLMNSAEDHFIGARDSTSGSDLFNGYMADFVFLDGVSAGPDEFGEWHPSCPNKWIPKDVSGLDYSGTNSFHLDFGDNTSTTTLGYDVSGNNNHWTLNGIGTDHQKSDTPTNNSAILNTLFYNVTSQEYTEGGLRIIAAATIQQRDVATIAMNSGKWYYEFVVISGNNHMCGIGKTDEPYNNYPGSTANSYGFHSPNGNKYNNATSTAYGTVTTTANDIIMCAFDLDDGKIWWGKNGTWFASGDPAAGTNAAYTGIDTSLDYWPIFRVNVSFIGHVKFNDDELTYTPPTGFKSVMVKNLPQAEVPDPTKYISTTLYTGNATIRHIETPNKVDYNWIKNRDTIDSWRAHSLKRGIYKYVTIDQDNGADEYTDLNGLFEFAYPTGFKIGTGANGLNDNTEKFLSISFTVDPKFLDIQEYVGNETVRTISHNLNSVPKFYFAKGFGNENWHPCYFEPLGNTQLAALNNGWVSTSSNYWNNTSPAANDITLGIGSVANDTGFPHLAYIFKETLGLVKTFLYTGNGSTNGTFVYLGFEPEVLIVKRNVNEAPFLLLDRSRNTYNPVDISSNMSVSAAEVNGTYLVDFVSNGIKFKSTSAEWNANAVEYIGVAFARSPFNLE